MEKLGILITGKAGTGKSCMMHLLEKFLLKEGFDVELLLEDELIDYKTEGNFRVSMGINTEMREAAIKEKSKIQIKTLSAELSPIQRGGEYSSSTK